MKSKPLISPATTLWASRQKLGLPQCGHDKSLNVKPVFKASKVMEIPHKKPKTNKSLLGTNENDNFCDLFVFAAPLPDTCFLKPGRPDSDPRIGTIELQKIHMFAHRA